MLIGLGPYNFVGVSAGGMISSLKSIDDVFTWNVLATITVIALIAGGPAYILRAKTKNGKISHEKKISGKRWDYWLFEWDLY